MSPLTSTLHLLFPCSVTSLMIPPLYLAFATTQDPATTFEVSIVTSIVMLNAAVDRKTGSF